MGVLTIRDFYGALGTYGAGGAIVYRDAAELAPMIKADLKLNKMERKPGGSSRTYNRSRYTDITIDFEAMSVYLNTYIKFMGHQSRQAQDSAGNNVPGFGVTGNDIAPNMGLMFILDSEEEAFREVVTEEYRITDRWVVIRALKGQLSHDGQSGTTLIRGEDPANEPIKLTFQGEMLDSPSKDIYDSYSFASEEEARLYIFRTLGVQVPVAVAVNPDAENENDRIVNINLPGGRAVGLADLARYLGNDILGNRQIRNFLIGVARRVSDSFIPGSGEVLGQIIGLDYAPQENQGENDNENNVNNNENNEEENNINNDVDNP